MREDAVPPRGSGDRWLALLGWHAAALHCTAGERWIGWSRLQRLARLFLTVGNTRLLVLSEGEDQPGLASQVLGRSLRRLASDWQTLHGYSQLLAKTCVKKPRRETCYRAATRGARPRDGEVGVAARVAPRLAGDAGANSRARSGNVRRAVRWRKSSG